ncbi:MAG: glycosyltransferase [Bacteroidales bacterium]
MIAVIIFWGLVFFLFHSYVLFPVLLSVLSRNRENNTLVYENPGELPSISVLMSVYNEKKVIREKIHSILNTSYPLHKIQILIGSDHSTDGTDDILKELQREEPILQLYFMEGRRGKGSVINTLSREAEGNILVLTDANVILQRNTLYELVKHFKNPDIGLVDSYMLNTGIKKDGISYQEMAYISREIRIKNREGRIWGCMMGPSGGCYAVRRELFAPIPETILVDDFYINMLVLEKGYRSVNELHARVYEDVSNDLSEEFRRKVRIAAGNFQNLVRFRKLLWPITRGCGFCFFSHKLIRWTGPFILIFLLITNLLIFQRHPVYQVALLIQAIMLAIPIIDQFLRKIQIHIVILRFVTHFYAMNLALLAGFLKNLKGIRNNVWQPTRRYQ